MGTHGLRTKRRMRLPIVPLALIITFVGTLFFVLTLVGLVFSYRSASTHQHLVTAPADVRIELEPGAEYAVYHCLTGSHITLNRPLIALPETLSIDLIDPDAAQAIQMKTIDTVVSSSFFENEQQRRAIRTFIVPKSGVVDLSVKGVQGDQVFAVGPMTTTFQSRSLPRYITELTISIIVILLGFALIIKRLASVSLDLDLQEQS
jgi:hypothetical protein